MASEVGETVKLFGIQPRNVKVKTNNAISEKAMEAYRVVRC
jgi:hypothetical protein